MKKFSFGLPVALGVALIAACGSEDISPVTRQGAVVAAELLDVEPQRIEETYTTTGDLIADDRVEIASRLMGFIRELEVREGSTVTQGQLLLTIDPTEIEAQLNEAEARVAQARARVEEAKADFERFKSLAEQRLVAENVFTKAELEYQLAQQELRAALATLDRIKVQLKYAEIRSPVSGVVVDKHRQAGDIATPGAPILTIENPDNIVLRTFIREDHLRHVQNGDEVTISVDAVGLKTRGVITRLVPSGDPGTHSYLVKATLNRLDAARSGMFARAEFTIGAKWGILIPAAAVVTRADLPGVYLVDDEGIAHFRMLRTGRRFDDRVEILSGLEGGERIVVQAEAPLRTGDKVVPSERGPDTDLSETR